MRDDADAIRVPAAATGAVREPVFADVGSFRYWFDTDTWEWSPEVAALLGYRPGEVRPTSDLLRGHDHPEDQAGLDRLIAAMRGPQTHFCSRHRIVDTAGKVHAVLVVGRTVTGLDGAVAGAEGFYLESAAVTEPATVRKQVNQHIGEFREHQGVIEQAKGMLMLTYGVDRDRAFEVLRWRSQEENCKLHDVAQGIVDAVAARIDLPEQVRQEFDQVVLSPLCDD